MRIMGIDPGATGALVFLKCHVLCNMIDANPIEWSLMPTMMVGKAKRVNAGGVANFIRDCRIDHIYIEQVGAMPGQGVASMFSFGHNVGTMMGVIGALGIPHTLVRPQTWKKAAGLIGKDKDAARTRAMQLWPSWNALNKKGEGQAYADAALIARFGGEI